MQAILVCGLPAGPCHQACCGVLQQSSIPTRCIRALTSRHRTQVTPHKPSSFSISTSQSRHTSASIKNLPASVQLLPATKAHINNHMARQSTFTSLALVAAPLLLLVCASLATPATATGDCWAVCDNNQKHCNAKCDETGHKSSCYGKCSRIQRSCSTACDRKSQSCFSTCSSKQQSCGQECQYKVQEASQCFKECEEYPRLCTDNCNKNHIGQQCIDACNSAKVMNACNKGCNEKMQELSGCWDDCKKDQLECNTTCRGPFDY